MAFDYMHISLKATTQRHDKTSLHPYDKTSLHFHKQSYAEYNRLLNGDMKLLLFHRKSTPYAMLMII